MNTTAFCTISSLNYLPFAKTLLDSLKDVHSDADYHYCIVDKRTSVINIDSVELTYAEDLTIPHFNEMSFIYTITELNTAIKPFFLSHLLKRGYKKIVYLDPDIFVYNRLQKVLDMLDTYPVVLTPHALRPERSPKSFLDKIQWEQNMTYTGIFNLGFIGISNLDPIDDILHWWKERCQYLCFLEPSEGLFVDQKWSELMIAYWDSICILRDPGYNVSVWNLHERTINNFQVNGTTPLIFYHFSSFDVNNHEIISKHDPKLTLSQFPELQVLFTSYRDKVIGNGYYTYASIPYSYGFFADGNPIDEVERRIYAMVVDFYDNNPFHDTRKNFYKKIRLHSTKTKHHRNLFRTIACLGGKIIFSLLGPKVYRTLVKELSKAASLRAHSHLLS